ncbi:MAG: hypothetical protein V4557_09045 [Bacteroidota bacterium]
MKNLLILFTSCCFIVSAKAQSKVPITKHYLFPEVGLLNGDHSVSAQVKLTGGIQSKAWMFGLGTAIDYYKVRTVPVFADVRYAFGKKANYFSYANLGADLVWALETQYSQQYIMGVPDKNKFNNGIYADLGVGYAFRGEKKQELVISIGYSVKTLSSSYQQAVYKEFPPYGIEYRDRKLDYTLNRLVLRLGVRL